MLKAFRNHNLGVIAGATEAARGAADIVLTEPGLSTIVTAIIGARKIFQRMNTYAKYTVAMTFRVCLTFGILTVVYDWRALPLPPPLLQHRDCLPCPLSQVAIQSGFLMSSPNLCS